MSKHAQQNPSLRLEDDSLKDFHESYGDIGLSGYQIATEEICIRLSSMLDSLQDFNSLKKELSDFVKERNVFTGHLFNSYDDATGKYQL